MSFINPLQPKKDLSTWEVWLDEPQWVGPPRAEIDQAWKDLLSGKSCDGDDKRKEKVSRTDHWESYYVQSV